MLNVTTKHDPYKERPINETVLKTVKGTVKRIQRYVADHTSDKGIFLSHMYKNPQNSTIKK